MYVGVTKTCPFCNSTDAEYKFLNNKNIEQPRYKCLGCHKYFTHNPASRRRKHPQGYAKIAVAFSELLPNSATVSCPSPRCGKFGTFKFLYFNNGNVGQPRYKCGACNTPFTNGGRLSSKRKCSAEDANIPEEPSEETLDKIDSDLLPDTESQSFSELIQLFDTPEEGAESFPTETNGVELPKIKFPTFTVMMQSPGVPPVRNERILDEINFAELPDIDSQFCIELMELLDTPEEEAQSLVNERNRAELPNMGSQSFTPRMLSPGVPQEASAPILDELDLAELPDFNSKSFMEWTQLLDSPMKWGIQ